MTSVDGLKTGPGLDVRGEYWEVLPMFDYKLLRIIVGEVYFTCVWL